VQVNAINPGNVRTARYLQRLEQVAREGGIGTVAAEQKIVAGAKVTRIGEPDDISSLVAFVVSPEGRFLQGSLIDMDGGATKVI
jgi:NAD(P)-dependent dehydrogenase (short-subunit alcohol dehydrogenase family)